MKSKKQELGRKGAQEQVHEVTSCQMCGRKIEPDAGNWQEDDEGAKYCRDCNAERESCGCSD